MKNNQETREKRERAKSKKKQRKSGYTAATAHSKRYRRTHSMAKRKDSDIESILQEMNNIQLSIYKEQISSVALQKKTLQRFIEQLNQSWGDLLQHLSLDDCSNQNKEVAIGYALSYIKRQSIVANQIAQFRSQSEREINELALKEFQLIKILSEAKEKHMNESFQ